MLAVAPAGAQVDDEVISGVQFNFVSPGARSLGLGGAFVAIANDATTAFTNPAGLTNLTESEVSVEGRAFRSATFFTESGHAFGPPTGIGVDTIDEVSFAQTEDRSEGLSFLSWVKPIGRLRMALFRSELVNFQSSFETSGAFHSDSIAGPCVSFAAGLSGCGRLFPVRTNLQLDVEDYGAAFAFGFGEKLSLGIGVNAYRFEIAGTTLRHDLIARNFRAPGGFFGEPLFSEDNIFATQTQSGTDEALGINAGLLLSFNQHFSFGAAYREGVEFDYTYEIRCGPSDPAFCRGVPGLATGERVEKAIFGVPEVWSVGLAWRPTDAVTISVDFDRVEYSALVENFTVAASPLSHPEDFAADDADEWHVGLEYVFADLRRPIALRFGAWRDPAHQIRYDGADPAEAVALWAGSQVVGDETHYSAGLGFYLGERFSIDIAADSSERYDLASLSAVLRF